MKTKPFPQAALSLAVALAISACAAPKANPNLTLEATGQVMSAAETAERYDVNGNWWEIYQSPQLNALMEQALANNVDLKQAAISVNKALYQANILGADLVPSFSGSLGANASKNLKTGSHGNTFSSQLGLSYELDLWRKLSATADAQVWEYQATHEDMANTRLTLINNVADAYFNIAYLNEAIELAKKIAEAISGNQPHCECQVPLWPGRLKPTNPSQTVIAERGKQPVVFAEQFGYAKTDFA